MATMNLRPYQTEAAISLVAILQQHGIAYLRGEVRVGKTFTVLDALKRLGVKSCLFVTKKKAIASIEADRDAIGLSEAVTVTNYEQVAKRANCFYDVLIVDEAHGIGAYPKPSKRWHDLTAIRYKYLILMSGTPSPESYSQLYHQFRLGRSIWSGYTNFYEWAKAGYVSIGTKYVGTGQQVNDYSNANEARILADIEPLTVTVTQQQAGFTTAIEEQVHMVQMSRRTYRLALRIIKDGVIGRPDCRSVLADTGAKAMSKLRQIYSGTVITETHGAVIFDNTKAKYIMENFSGKLAILYCFKAEGDMLRKMFGSLATDSPEHFNANPDAVYIGQILSSREGVNLSTADHLIFIGIDYSALSYLQGRDRASYFGRDRANRVHFIFAERSVESRVYRSVKEKQTYTLKHFDTDRGQLSVEANQALRGRGVVCAEVDSDKQAGHTGPGTDETRPDSICGGQISIWPLIENSNLSA
jgi:hypothetical protein